MEDSVFWIWLQEALGAGNIKVDRVIRELGSAEALYNMSEAELRELELFAPKEIARIKATPLEHAQENARRAKRYGCQVITPDHPDYPPSYANIDCMPSVLYVVGELSTLKDELVLSMVGTRSSTEYGERAAEQLAFDLAAAGCTIASGLAVGIDYASHEGALRADGRSIGLLACGMDVDYPITSNTLKRRILDSGGALITEFPFGTAAFRYNFNIRNRLLSGLAKGVIVVQAPARSGALNTARHATEQNRDVFAVPGEIFDVSMTGCNRLIRDGGKIVVNVYSILEEYIYKFPDTIDAKSIVSKIKQAARSSPAGIPPAPETPSNLPRKVLHITPEDGETHELLMVAQDVAEPLVKLERSVLSARGLSDEAAEVYELLGRQPLDGDRIAEKTGFAAMKVMVALTELELSELVEVLPGKRYIVRSHE